MILQKVAADMTKIRKGNRAKQYEDTMSRIKKISKATAGTTTTLTDTNCYPHDWIPTANGEVCSKCGVPVMEMPRVGQNWNGMGKRGGGRNFGKGK